MQNHDHEPRFDPTVFAALREVLEDEAFAVAELFSEVGPELLAQIRSGCNGGDAGAITAGAHTLKSNSAQLGGMRLSALCRELEELSRKHPGADYTPYVNTIEAELNQLLAEMALLPR